LLAQKMSRAKFTATISVFNKNYLAERVQGANAADVRIVHCGVSPALFPMVTALRDSARILAIGRLDHIKGFCHLIDACAILRDKGVAFACDIVGSGPLETSLSAQIRAHGLDEHVYLLGARKQEEIRQFLHRAAIFALPSVVTPAGDRDGIPVALMEAMASGLPVVSTRVSGIPELVQDGVTGLLAAPADAASLAACIERLLADRPLAAALAARARHHVEQEFDVQKESKKLFAAISSSPCHA
jgi:colanic acid/amylovoran biosynthesis glycosyltransferase